MVRRRTGRIRLRKKELARRIEEILCSALEDKREREVLRLRFGLKDGKQRTLEEIGKYFNLTRERIRQIEARALANIRHYTMIKELKELLGKYLSMGSKK